jgi:hypothetical protein
MNLHEKSIICTCGARADYIGTDRSGHAGYVCSSETCGRVTTVAPTRKETMSAL